VKYSPFIFAKQIFHSGDISLGGAKFHSPQANFVEKREQVFRLALFFLRRIDKKDATMLLSVIIKNLRVVSDYDLPRVFFGYDNHSITTVRRIANTHIVHTKSLAPTV